VSCGLFRARADRGPGLAVGPGHRAWYAFDATDAGRDGSRTAGTRYASCPPPCRRAPCGGPPRPGTPPSRRPGHPWPSRGPRRPCCCTGHRPTTPVSKAGAVRPMCRCRTGRHGQASRRPARRRGRMVLLPASALAPFLAGPGLWLHLEPPVPDNAKVPRVRMDEPFVLFCRLPCSVVIRMIRRGCP
jgi:hypothetical protein